MKRIAPYQLFFPFGIFNALLAVLVWLTQDLGWFATPTIFIHSRLVMGGFLWSFITGFLMTAAPRMTGTRPANFFEYIVASLILLAEFVGSWILDGRLFYGAAMALAIFIAVYAGRRVFRSSRAVPVFFSHVGMGLMLALVGAFFYYKGDSRLGIHLYNVGAVLLLVLGIGTRFFSFLSGLPSAFENETGTLRYLFHASAIVVAGLLAAAGLGFANAYLALVFVMSFYLCYVWKIWRRSSRNSALKYGMWVISTLLPLSFLLCWLSPNQFVTWFHLLFIGCFALMTFSVATRVTLAHGSYPTALEMQSRSLWLLLTFLILTLVFRVAYGLSGDPSRIQLLHLAVGFWILSILVWCSSFLLKLWRTGPEARPSC